MYLHSRYRDLIFFPSKESLFAMIGQVQLEIWRFQCSQSIRLEARRKFVSCGDFLDWAVKRRHAVIDVKCERLLNADNIVIIVNEASDFI